MKNLKLKSKRYIRGTLKMPGDKSISHRAVMLGAISKGKTTIKNLLECNDCLYTIKAFRSMGVKVRQNGSLTYVYGKGLYGLKKPGKKIMLGDSGTSMRILSGILVGQNFKSVLCADVGLSKRPMDRITKPLSQMGARIKGRGSRDLPPLKIEGSVLKPISYATPIASAQVKSAILLAGLYTKGRTTVREKFKSRDHTERILKCFKARGAKIRGLSCSVIGKHELHATRIDIPGDISSAAFFIVGATLMKGSRLLIKDVGLNSTRTGFIKILKRMGADIAIKNLKLVNQELRGDILVKSSNLKSTKIRKSEIPLCIDELPILMVAAGLSRGKTVIEGASELRVKETDRISSMIDNLTKIGIEIYSQDDNVYIEGTSIDTIKGSTFNSYNDHRTAMSMAIAAILAKGPSKIMQVECVSKSYPDFFKTLEKLTRQ